MENSGFQSRRLVLSGRWSRPEWAGGRWRLISADSGGVGCVPGGGWSGRKGCEVLLDVTVGGERRQLWDTGRITRCPTELDSKSRTGIALCDVAHGPLKA